jgi:hypothetical protein
MPSHAPLLRRKLPRRTRLSKAARAPAVSPGRREALPGCMSRCRGPAASGPRDARGCCDHMAGAPPPYAHTSLFMPHSSSRCACCEPPRAATQSLSSGVAAVARCRRTARARGAAEQGSGSQRPHAVPRLGKCARDASRRAAESGPNRRRRTRDARGTRGTAAKTGTMPWAPRNEGRRSPSKSQAAGAGRAVGRRARWCDMEAGVRARRRLGFLLPAAGGAALVL